jgi:hypothetical protein
MRLPSSIVEIFDAGEAQHRLPVDADRIQC